MKVNLEVDMTPEEMRRVLGLPDVTPVNDLLVERLRDQVEKGLDGTMLRNMVQSMIKGGTQGIEAYQSLLSTVFARAQQKPSESGAPPADDAGQDANTGAGKR